MPIKTPHPLQPGDTVAVVATARAVNREAVEKAVKLLHQWGLQVETGNALYQQQHLFAGSDQQRLQDLQKALDAPHVKTIFCARGGYGTTRILDLLDWKGFRKNPKWVCGFSDITALLCRLYNLGYESVHSTMPQLFDFKKNPEDLQSLKSILFGKGGTIKAGAQINNRYGSAKGPLVGGNLSLLVNNIGTASEPDTKGGLLFLEEVDEYLYHLDRMMIHLKRSGKLRQLAGVIIGHLTKMKEGDLLFGTDAAGVIRSHLDEYGIPLAFGFPIGHDSPNLAIPVGRIGQLEVTATGSELRF